MQKPTPLLLLPGLMNDERVWDPVRQALPAARTVVTVRTDSVDNIAALAATALSNMPAGRIAVAGFSLGGYVALEVCRRARDRIAGVALLDTGARADTEESKQNRQRMIAALTTGSANFAQVAGAFASRVLHPEHVTDATLLDLLADMARVVGTEGFVRQQTAAMNRRDMRDILGDLDCPALVLCGREDLTTPPQLSEEMAQLLKGDVELMLVPHSGHMSTIEQPATIVDAVLRWLSKVDSAIGS